MDFIDVGVGAARWPTFNLADAFIVVGGSVLVLWMGAETPDQVKNEASERPTRTRSDPAAIPSPRSVGAAVGFRER